MTELASDTAITIPLGADSGPSMAFSITAQAQEEIETSSAFQLVGQVLGGRYRLEEIVGFGGVAAVFRASHRTLRRKCAVKVLYKSMSCHPEVVARFEREAVALARIHHPNVTAVYDFDWSSDGTPFLALELVRGKDLATVLQAGPLSELAALTVARQVASALEAAHAAGVVHRDLKPANTMLVGGNPANIKLFDFGVAKVAEEFLDANAPMLTRLNTLMGTPSYMSPEQALGEAVDHRSDLYALGTLVYEMLQGTLPFADTSLTKSLVRKTEEVAPDLSAPVEMATRELVRALLRRSPEERPFSAAEVTRQIDLILGKVPL